MCAPRGQISIDEDASYGGTGLPVGLSVLIVVPARQT
jgi:hypothetical protein